MSERVFDPELMAAIIRRCQDRQDIIFQVVILEMLSALSEVLREPLTASLHVKLKPDIDEVVSQLTKLVVLEESSSFNPPVKLQIDQLPPGTKYYWSFGECYLVLVEHAPTVRTISVNDDLNMSAGDGTCTPAFYRLAMPFVRHVLYKDAQGNSRFCCFFGNEPWSGETSTLYAPCLPNIFTETRNCEVCLGGWKPNTENPALAVQRSIDFFWQTSFNTDLLNSHNDMAKRDERLSTFVRWQEETERDSGFITKVQWITTPTTIGQMTNELTQEAILHSQSSEQRWPRADHIANRIDLEWLHDKLDQTVTKALTRAYDRLQAAQYAPVIQAVLEDALVAFVQEALKEGAA